MKLPDPRRIISGLFPILGWSRGYDINTAVGDLIAGITVALTLIPQSIAYASLAGFEPQYGLYASFAGGFVYAIMGTCPQINIGPTALLSLMTFTYTNGTNPDFAVLLCFIGGIVQLIAGTAQLGFLVEFVSLPVVSGFTSAAAITIASSQLKGLLGLKFKAESFIGTWEGVFGHIQDTRLQDTLLSLVCCIVLMGMKALKEIRVKDPVDEKGRRTAQIIQKSLWFAGVARNAVVVVLAAVLAYFVHQDKGDPLILTGNITPGLPRPQPPPFHTQVGNTTYTVGGMLAHLGSGLIVVPLVGIISNVAIAKAFAKGRTLDATQEIVALGACNIIGAFFRSFPVNGSFTRSAVSDSSGVRTPAAGFYTGIIVLLTLALLTPYFYFIPRAALSSVIVCAVLHMVDLDIVKRLWATSMFLILTPYFYFIPRAALSLVIVCAVLHMVDLDIVKRLWATSRLDLIPLVGTFICCLVFGIEIGLIGGVGVDVILLLYYHSRPPLDVRFVDDGNLPPHYAVRPVGGLHFASAERVRSQLIALRTPKKLRQPTLETLTVISDENSRTNGNGTSVSRNGTSSATNGGSVVANGTSALNGRRTSSILVIFCDGLYRMDYTFLQSLKMLAADWLRSGRIVWCDVKPEIRSQLDSIIHDAVYCDTADLRMFLTGISVIEEPHFSVNSDTQL